MTKRNIGVLTLFLLTYLLLPGDIVYAQPSAVTWVKVTNGNDDAEEQYGQVNLTSNDIEMVENKNNPQLVGVRFRNVDIPRGL
ncbi:MAG: hypothetical protein AAF702_34410 [Chloroflexota bacterium]